MCVCGGGGRVLGLAVVYHGFREGPVSCRCVSWLYWEGGGGSCVLPLYIMALGGGSCVLPLYIMALGGVLGLAVVYHGFRGGPRFCRCISWL